jgi:hypothetical protein
MIINLALYDEIAAHLSGARNDRLGKRFSFLNQDLGSIFVLTKEYFSDCIFCATKGWGMEKDL